MLILLEINLREDWQRMKESNERVEKEGEVV